MAHIVLSVAYWKERYNDATMPVNLENVRFIEQSATSAMKN